MSTSVVFNPHDWVIIKALARIGRVRKHGDGFRTEAIERGALCPRSIYEDAEAYAEWLRTGVIPPETPELRRICRIVDLEPNKP